MHDSRLFRSRPLMRRVALLVAIGLLPTPALAQYIGGAPPPLPAAPRPGEVETPTAALARAVRTLAQSPRDFAALINAGHAAVDLGDMQTAIGFFGRAEEVRPSDPAPKIGMGAATVATGDARGALIWFAQAQQLGASSVAIGADRGLAQDLLGNQLAAQSDYRAALAGPERDEARRRLALSLGISGNRAAAFTTLQPLLMRRDPAAQRIRAFVLALVGDERGASSAIDTAMPGSGSRMAGFFRLLPSLSVEQKAAAVHLGIFPDPSQIRVAAVSPRVLAGPVDQRRFGAGPPAASQLAQPQPGEARQAGRRRALRTRAEAPVVSVGQRRPMPSPPVIAIAAAPAPVVVATPQPGFAPVTAPPVEIAEAPPVPTAGPATSTFARSAEPDPVVTPVSADRLSGIDRLLAQADELPVPPVPRRQFEKPLKSASLDTAKTRKAAEAKKAAEFKKTADAKQAAEDKADRETIGLAGTNWVQLAGGARADRMGFEYKRLSGKSPTLRKKGGAVTAGKDYFRLLTGPFESKNAAQEFVNQLAKDGVDGFSWTRTPATLRIEKITPK